MSEAKDRIEAVISGEWKDTHAIAREAGMEWGWRASNMVSETLCRMARYGLVERRLSPSDRRITEWRLKA